MCKPEENWDYYRDMPYGSMTYLIECKLFTHLRLPIGRKQVFVFFSKATDSESAAWVNLQLCDSMVLPREQVGARAGGDGAFGMDGLGGEPTDTAPRSLRLARLKSISHPTLIVAPCPCQLPQLCSQGLLCQSLPNTHADYSLSYISQLYRGG